MIFISWKTAEDIIFTFHTLKLTKIFVQTFSKNVSGSLTIDLVYKKITDRLISEADELDQFYSWLFAHSMLVPIFQKKMKEREI